MPINFQPPSPLGSAIGVGVGAGRADVTVKDLPVLQRALAERMQMAAQAAALQQHGLIAGAQMAQRGQEFNAAQALQANEFNAKMQMEADQQATAQQMQRERLEHALYMQENEVTLHDKTEVLRLKRGLAEVDAGLASGVLSPEDADESRKGIYTHLAPYQLKMAKARIAAEDERVAQARAESERAAELWKMQTGNQLGFWHETANKLAGVPNPTPGGIRALDIHDSQGNVIGHQVTSPEGKTVLLPRDRTAEMDAQAVKVEKANWFKAYHFTNDRIKEDIAMRQRLLADELKSHPFAQPHELKNRPSTWEDPKVRAEVFAGIMREQGFAPTWEEHLRSLHPQASPNSPGNVGVPGSDAPPTKGASALPDLPKLSINDLHVFDKMSPEQRQGWKATTAILQAVEDPRLSPAEQQSGRDLVDAARETLVGGDRKGYEAAMLKLNQILVEAAKRPQPAGKPNVLLNVPRAADLIGKAANFLESTDDPNSPYNIPAQLNKLIGK